jgi:hypothetical protein
VRTSLTDRIAQAIGDPGSMLARGDNYSETVTRWSTRAVESVLNYSAPPAGVDARFAAVVLTIHCSHCHEPYENEYGPVRFGADQLQKLADFGLDDEGWIVNVDGLHDDQVGDRKLVCPRCLECGWCDVCDEEIRAWQQVTNTVDAGVVHEGCVDQATTDTRPYLSEVPGA